MPLSDEEKGYILNKCKQDIYQVCESNKFYKRNLQQSYSINLGVFTKAMPQNLKSKNPFASSDAYADVVRLIPLINKLV